jgi:hypothetical protein
VGIDYRDDVYAALKAYADTSRNWKARTKNFLTKPCAIIAAPAWIVAEGPARRGGKIAQGTDRRWKRILKTTSPRRTQELKFTKAELEGVPEDFLSQQGIKTGDGRIHAQGQHHVPLHHGGGQREARGHAQTHADRAVQSRARGEHSPPPKNPRPARRRSRTSSATRAGPILPPRRAW